MKYIATEAPDFTGIMGVQSLRKLFECCSDKRLKNMFPVRDWRKVLKFYELPDERNELDMIIAIRMHLYAMQCEEEGLTGIRWRQADEGEPIRVAITSSTNRAYGTWIKQSVKKWLATTKNLDVVFVRISEDPQIVWTDDMIDGMSGVQAATYRKANDPNDDLSYGDEEPDVLVIIDRGDSWTVPKMLAVFEHEWGHVFGLKHLKRGNKMWDYPDLPFDEPLGPEDESEITARYDDAEEPAEAPEEVEEATPQSEDEESPVIEEANPPA